MTKPLVLVTGVNGGIGSAVARLLSSTGYCVIGTDTHDQSAIENIEYVQCDLSLGPALEDSACGLVNVLQNNDSYAESGLYGLVNNAAVQILGKADELTADDFFTSLCVNVVAPFAIARRCADALARADGVVVNIGSVHSRATKPRFSAYATSKAALDGLTRGLAIDYAGKFRVVGIAPAAIDTPMLRAGFRDDQAGLKQLKSFHPVGRIGTTDDVASVVSFLLGPGSRFINGTTVVLDGGLLCKLPDPTG